SGNNGTMTVSEVYLDINQGRYKEIVHCKKAMVVYYIKKDNSAYKNYQLFIGCGVILKTKKTL
ncbi:MAG TPA: hypothetical protein VNW06_02940, partial [Cytophagaceae bacterium]|nr:hypothetical protein [Cytophagaceae bacterium]